MSPRDERPSSVPPRFSSDEREHLLAQLQKVNARVGVLELRAQQKSQLNEHVTDLRRAFDELSGQVREMLARDIEQERSFSELKLRVEQIAAHSGGQVGALTGKVEGRESAREENRGTHAKSTVIAMVISAITAVIIAAIQAATAKPVPLPAPQPQPVPTAVHP